MPNLDGIDVVKDEVHRGYLEKAYKFGYENSDDIHTKVSALLVKDGEIISYGTNRIPTGVKKLRERLSRENGMKYVYLTHAERLSVYSAAKRGVSTEGSVMYAPWYACTDCAMAIIEGGIKEVVGHKTMMEKTAENSSRNWNESITKAFVMLKEAGVRTLLYDGKIGNGTRALFDEKEWRP